MQSSDKTPLGAKYNKETQSVEFRLYSKNATKVFLCIFNNPVGELPVMSLEMKKEENDIFFTSIKDYMLNCFKNPIYYGFRVFGENWVYDDKYFPGSAVGFRSKFDKKGNRFNPNKLAYDPYCLELSHLPSDVNPVFNIFRTGAEFHLIDNAKWAPKSVYYPKPDVQIADSPKRAFIDEVIGEVHIKDLTQNINMDERGTYLGVKKFAKTIKNLGITMIEFLPLNEFDFRQGGFNHWGYMPLGYFSLARRYGYNKMMGNLLNEFRMLVDEFHKNDIKVCLDMVYNHTGEAGLVNNNPDDANLISYSLIDNSTYYKVFENGYYRSNSGCGNDFNIASDAVLNLVADSLAFWANQGVDAFRFDLAAALLESSVGCEESYDYVNSCADKLIFLLKDRGIEVADDFTNAKNGIILIAEPWTCGGTQCYHLGKFPKFFAEWNDISRDTIRKITLKPDTVTPEHIKDVFEGTPSKFDVNKSVNYIACHDGFTLYDLNTYKHKNPSTSGGSNWEISGDYDGNKLKKENAIRKQLAMLFLIKGTPMIQIGDIIMQTKEGNNNSYNQDNYVNYLNWEKALKKDSFENRIMEYCRNLINFRFKFNIQNAKIISYHYDNFEIADSDNKGYWDNPKDDFFGVLLESDKRIYVVNSKSNDTICADLPSNNENKSWYLYIDTNEFNNITLQKRLVQDKYYLNPHSLCVFVEE